MQSGYKRIDTNTYLAKIQDLANSNHFSQDVSAKQGYLQDNYLIFSGSQFYDCETLDWESPSTIAFYAETTASSNLNQWVVDIETGRYIVGHQTSLSTATAMGYYTEATEWQEIESSPYIVSQNVSTSDTARIGAKYDDSSSWSFQGKFYFLALFNKTLTTQENLILTNAINYLIS